MIRFFAVKEANAFSLSSVDEHHLVHVLRAKKNEHVHLIVDETIYPTIITSLNPLQFRLVDESVIDPELPYALTCYYVIPKGDKWTFAIQKAVELGVTHFIGVQSSQSVVHWNEEAIEKKMARFTSIIKEAVMQSGRRKMMKLSFMTFSQVMEQPINLGFIASEHDRLASTPLPHISLDQPLQLLVGAEGGFSSEEVALAKAKGWIPLSLGPRILRTETALISSITRLHVIKEQCK